MKSTKRPFDPGDKEDVLNILSLNIPKYFAEEEFHDLDYYLDHEIEFYFVACIDDKIVGSGGVNFEDNHHKAKISWDIIHPDHQGKRIGSQLLKYRIEWIKSTYKSKKISVRTSQFVYPFYEKHGFRTISIVPNYWAKGFDLYEMILDENY